jgi:hypothetical protein
MSLKEAMNRKRTPLFFYSNIVPSITIPGVAENVAMPSVTIPSSSLPGGSKIAKAFCHFAYGSRQNTNGSDNYIDGNQYLQVKESEFGEFQNAVLIPDGSMKIISSEGAIGGGDNIYGNIDRSDEISLEDKTYEFQWALAKVYAASMIIYDVKSIIELRWG